MDGILIVAHGSRAKKTQDTLNYIVENVRKQLPQMIIEAAYMEFCEVNIEKGLTALVERGVNNINVIPYFLFEGIHIQQDIPEEIAAFSQNHPDVTITLGSTLGEDKRLADVLRDRIVESFKVGDIH